jgi:hypothetical protein
MNAIVAQGVLEEFSQGVAGISQHGGVVEVGFPRYDHFGDRVLLVGLNTRSVRSMAACSFSD